MDLLILHRGKQMRKTANVYLDQNTRFLVFQNANGRVGACKPVQRSENFDASADADGSFRLSGSAISPNWHHPRAPKVLAAR